MKEIWKFIWWLIKIFTAVLFLIFVIYIFTAWFSPTIVPDYLLEQGKMTEGDMHSLLYFLSGVATTGIFFGGWYQLNQVTQKNKAEYLLEIDKRWCSEEITKIRKELWHEYKKTRSTAGVQLYILGIADRSQKKPYNMDHLFQHLNFLELLGTIYANRQYLTDEEFKNIFGGKLLIYIQFYEEYLKTNDDLRKSNPYQLILYMKKIRTPCHK